MEARISVRLALPFAVIGLIALGGCDRLGGGGNEIDANTTITTDVPRDTSNLAGVTPMAERVAVIGLLNKRNGIVQDLKLKPGQAVRVKDVIVRLRACETTAPWESEKLTGAFLQVDVRRPDGKWYRRFSGWLYKESPSLNVVEDPTYDVWPKSCEMKWPAGPEAPDAPAASSNRSSAPKSGEEGDEAPSTDEPAAGEAPAAVAPAPSDDNEAPSNPA